MLKRIVIASLFLSFLTAAAVTAAIEKQKPKRETEGATQPGDTSESDGGSARTPLQEREFENERRPDYDDFVDKNNNGIDDRAEKKKEGIKKTKSSDTDKSLKSSLKKAKDKSARRVKSSGDSVIRLKNK